MSPSTTKSAVTAVLVAVLAAAAEVWLAVQATAAWSPAGPLALLMAFLAGPLLFAALLAWMRRRHVTRSRFLLALTVLVAGVGLIVLGNDYYRFTTEPPDKRTLHSNPVMLPLYQWLAVLASWVGLGVVESREKRLAAKPSA
jgi:hypothetical protein